VNSSTIYRIGSITKVFTFYVSLLETGFQNFKDPTTKYVPEMTILDVLGNPLNTTDWNEVTIGALASHLVGLSCDAPGTLALDQ
jgi:CubicO group peptidase (beta-lactamase class C family)